MAALVFRPRILLRSFVCLSRATAAQRRYIYICTHTHTRDDICTWPAGLLGAEHAAVRADGPLGRLALGGGAEGGDGLVGGGVDGGDHAVGAVGADGAEEEGGVGGVDRDLEDVGLQERQVSEEPTRQPGGERESGGAGEQHTLVVAPWKVPDEKPPAVGPGVHGLAKSPLTASW